MLTRRQVVSSAALFVMIAALGSAQSIVSAHSGTVDYFEGDVTIDGAKLVSQVARFSDLKEQSVLHTGMGRAEILLTPGVLLRVGENTSVKMLDNRLMSTRVEFLSGTAMLETDDAVSTIKDPAVTIVYKDFQAQPVKSGLIEVASQPSQLRVFKGEAKVTGNGTSLNVKDGNQVDLSTTMAMTKFDDKQADDLYLWSRDRAASLSAGNMSSARTLAASGYGNTMGYGNSLGYGPGYGGMGNAYAYAGWNPAMWNGFSGGWYYNSYLNMYSYLPFAGTMYSPFGYGFYNPATIAQVYVPGYYWQGAGGARTGTTAGVPLTSITPRGSSSNPILPRLGETATTRPLSAVTQRQPSVGFGQNPAALRNAGNQPGFSSSSQSSAGVSSSGASSAPAAAAAPAASAGRASAGRR